MNLQSINKGWRKKTPKCVQWRAAHLANWVKIYKGGEKQKTTF